MMFRSGDGVVGETGSRWSGYEDVEKEERERDDMRERVHGSGLEGVVRDLGKAFLVDCEMEELIWIYPKL